MSPFTRNRLFIGEGGNTEDWNRFQTDFSYGGDELLKEKIGGFFREKATEVSDYSIPGFTLRLLKFVQTIEFAAIKPKSS